jgi:hypothetical protein
VQIIHHRRNTAALLADTPTEFGVEIDLRSQGERLTVHHDPFVPGEDFETWIAGFNHRTLILNVKEEGLEARLLAVMAARGIEDFFFLDQSVPFLIRTARTGERRCAVRMSEFEPVEGALRLAGTVDWLWLDSFTDALPAIPDVARAVAAGFRICLVSPELQARDIADVARMRAHFDQGGIAIDAVCTKVPNAWL